MIITFFITSIYKKKKRYNFKVHTLGYPVKIYLVTPLLNPSEQNSPRRFSHVSSFSFIFLPSVFLQSISEIYFPKISIKIAPTTETKDDHIAHFHQLFRSQLIYIYSTVSTGALLANEVAISNAITNRPCKKIIISKSVT